MVTYYRNTAVSLQEDSDGIIPGTTFTMLINLQTYLCYDEADNIMNSMKGHDEGHIILLSLAQLSHNNHISDLI